MKFKNIGLLGAIIVQVSFLPQIIKIINTHNVSGLSSEYYLTLGLGCLLLLFYAQANNDMVMRVCHIWALINISTILFLIWKLS